MSNPDLKRTTIWLYKDITALMLQVLKTKNLTLSEWMRQKQLEFIQEQINASED